MPAHLHAPHDTILTHHHTAACDAAQRQQQQQQQAAAEVRMPLRVEESAAGELPSMMEKLGWWCDVQ
jgi:hypothetical protein